MLNKNDTEGLQGVLQGKVGVAGIAIIVLAVGLGVADNLLDTDMLLKELEAIDDE